MSCRTVFNLEWTDKSLNPQWADWIECVVNDPYKARCRWCMKTFNLSNMGRQAIFSHEKSIKHKKVMKSKDSQTTVDCCFSLKKNIEKKVVMSKIQRETSSSTKECCSNTLSNYVSKEVLLSSEIVWAMKLVMSHSSYNSFKDAAEIFKLMFSDSEIVKKISLGSSKMAYVIAFGLFPYFQKELIKEISDTKFVLCFDEALNRVAQKGQMDLIIRYWPDESKEVQVRFLNSLFLGHATAKDLYEKFIEGSSELNLRNLLQISLDGPNVNLKFLTHIKDELKDTKGHSLLDLGTCSLHVMHGAFQMGNKVTKWKLNETFSSLYRLFKDSPARRADFISKTNSNVFPLKFCQSRWVENVNVAERALDVFPNVQKYLHAFKNDLPNNFTLGNIESACYDKLILAKIASFCSVANILQPFLKKFQTPNPMAPFLYDSLTEVIRLIMSRFMRQEIIGQAKTPYKLFQLDVSSSSNHKRHNDIDIGIATRSYLVRSGATDSEKNEFFIQAKLFLVEMCTKILEKCPINFSVVRSLSCLNPHLISSNSVLAETRMNTLLQILLETNNLSALSADRAKQQFIDFTNKVQAEWKENFATFRESKSRLDAFLSSFLCNKEEFKDLWQVVKLVLTLSHGNASVESGFSINKDILVENLHETSLIALRTTYDAIKSKGGVASVPITSEMLQYVKMSRNRYHLALEEQKKFEEKDKKQFKDRKRVNDQIKLLKQKKAKLSTEINIQNQKIDAEIFELEKKVL